MEAASRWSAAGKHGVYEGVTDARDVAGLLIACARFDDGVADVELSDVIADWQRPSVDLDTMTAVVFDESLLVAFAQGGHGAR